MKKERRPSDDTVDMKVYVDAMLAQLDRRIEQRFADQKEAIGAALASADKATSIQETNAEKWRASANEWRGAMSDRDRELPSRREVDTAVSGLEKRLRLLEDGAQSSQGRSDGIQLTTGVLVGAITLAATLAGLVAVVVSLVTP